MLLSVCRRKRLFLPVTELLIRPVVFSVALFRVFPTVLEASRVVQVYFPNATPYLRGGGGHSEVGFAINPFMKATKEKASMCVFKVIYPFSESPYLLKHMVIIFSDCE